jgi:hypothetical protein
MQNNEIQNVSVVNFGSSNELNVSSSNLQYNGDVVITSSNIDEYIEQINWSGDATSSLSMNHYDINNASTVQIGNVNTIQVNDNFDLTVNQNKIITQSQDIADSETRALTEYIPNSPAIMNGTASCGNVLSSINLQDTNYYLTNPVRINIDLDFSCTTDAPIELNDTDVYAVIGLCNNENEANSSVRVDYIKITGNAMRFTDDYHYISNVNLITNHVVNSSNIVLQSGVVLLNGIQDIMAQFEADPDYSNLEPMNAWYYVKLYGVINSSNTYLQTFNSTITIPTGTYNDEYFMSVKQPSISSYLVEVNENENQNNTTSLQLYQTVQNVVQVDGFNNLMVINLPPVSGDNGCTVLITASVVSVKYTVKYCCVLSISEGNYIIDTDSLSTIHLYNPFGILLNASYSINGDNNIVVVNQIDDTHSSINTASVKVELQINNY